MQTPAPVAITLRLRARCALAGLIMLALWVASVVAMFRDGGALNIILTAIATVTILPLGLVALLGGVHGSEAGMRRAHIALFAAGGLLAVTVIVEMLRRTVFAGS